MQIPRIAGLIKRRLLVNYRFDPDVLQRLLPSPLRPKLFEGNAIAGICLIRLEQIRPAGFPALLGTSSENAAHRIAVEWKDSAGQTQEGVYIPRRDTGSLLAHLAGGRIFPGEHHLARFIITDAEGLVNFRMTSKDGGVRIDLRGREGDELPAASCFGCLQNASRFFENGSLGYSVTSDADRLDGLRLHVENWRVRALAIEHLESSFFDGRTVFPEGSAIFDHALIMRDIQHQWRHEEDLRITPRAVAAA